MIESLSLSPLFILGLIALGGGVGYASGLFGVGGGFIVTPLLISLFALKVQHAVGAEVTQMIATGLIATRRHALAGFCDLRMGLYMAPTIIVGTMIGKASLDTLQGLGTMTVLGKELSVINTAVSLCFIILLVSIAIYLLRAKDDPEADGTAPSGGPLCWATGPWTIALPASGIPRCSLVTIGGCGLLIGFLAGMLGIGGGVLLIPLLILGFGMPLRMAIGTGPLLILFSAFFSTIGHALAGNVDLRIVIALLLGSTVGVQVGAWHSHRLGTGTLRQAFALLVLAVVAIVAGKLILTYWYA